MADMEPGSDGGRVKPPPAEALPEVRAWTLDGLSVVEVAAADGAPMFFVRCGERWVRCRNLEGAIDVVWDLVRTRAQLPPQWTVPGSEVLEDFNGHWDALCTLPPGQWWPAAPEPLHCGTDGDPAD